MLVPFARQWGALVLAVAMLAAASATRAEEVWLSDGAWDARLGAQDVHLVPIPVPAERLWQVAIFVDGRETKRLSVAVSYRLAGVFEFPDRWVLLMANTHGGYYCHSHYFSTTISKKDGGTEVSPYFTTCGYRNPHVARRANRLQVGFEKTFLEADFFEYDLAAGAFVAAERAFPVSQYAPPADPQTRARAILPMPQPEARQ